MPGAALVAEVRAVHFVGVGVGELEEGKRAAVGHFEEGVAVVHLAAERGVEGTLTPGGDEGDAENVLDEGAVGLLVLHREGVVVQAKRWVGEQRRTRRGGVVLRHVLLLVGAGWLVPVVGPVCTIGGRSAIPSGRHFVGDCLAKA